MGGSTISYGHRHPRSNPLPSGWNCHNMGVLLSKNYCSRIMARRIKVKVSSCSTSKDQEIQRLQEKERLSKEGCMKSLIALQSHFTFLTDTLKDFETQQLLNEKKSQTHEVQINTVQALNVDSAVMEKTCSGKDKSNLETVLSKLVKENSLDSKTKDVHAIKYKMSKAKERCMTYFRSLHSHLHVLSKEYLKGTHESNRSGNDTDTDDADIRPIYDEEPMAEGLQVTEHSNKSLILIHQLDNKTTEF
ncbi:hypothetical protein Tco_0982426 [Tanacetum coccineum]